MAMGFLLNDIYGDIEPSEVQASLPVNPCDSGTSRNLLGLSGKKDRQIPEIGKILSRKRLLDLIDHSTAQYGATLISGRAGTGKTTLAADYAKRQKKVSWYSIDPADADWLEFSQLFFTTISGRGSTLSIFEDEFPSEAMIAEYLVKCHGGDGDQEPHLIVLDNIHHLFDQVWFSSFFKQLIVSLDSSTRLLMLCRGKPSAPLWRMRSKQMLNVIEESLLDLNLDEALAICDLKGIPKEQVRSALERSYGRVGTFLDKLSDSTNLQRGNLS